MERIVPAVLGAFLLCAVTSGGLAAEKTVALPGTGKVKVGGQAPGLSSWDPENNLVRLSKILEEPGTRAVLVSFYASWCRECRRGLGMLGREQDRLGKAGVRVLLVNHGESAGTVQAHREREEIALPVVTDEFKEIGSAYGVRVLPVSFLVGPDSTVKAIYTYEGEDFVQRILADARK